MQVNYQAILNQSPDAIGDCERSLGSYQSTLKQTQAKLTDIKTLIGQFFMPTFQKILSLGNRGLVRIRDWLTKLQAFADKVGGANRMLTLLAATGAAVVVALNFKKIISGAESVLKILSKINLKAMAIVAVIVLLALLVDDFINFIQGNDSVIGHLLENAGIDVDETREKSSTHGTPSKRHCRVYGSSSRESVSAYGAALKLSGPKTAKKSKPVSVRYGAQSAPPYPQFGMRSRVLPRRYSMRCSRFGQRGAIKSRLPFLSSGVAFRICS